jgi:hypothetical protein
MVSQTYIVTVSVDLHTRWEILTWLMDVGMPPMKLTNEQVSVECALLPVMELTSLRSAILY